MKFIVGTLLVSALVSSTSAVVTKVQTFYANAGCKGASVYFVAQELSGNKCDDLKLNSTCVDSAGQGTGYIYGSVRETCEEVDVSNIRLSTKFIVTTSFNSSTCAKDSGVSAVGIIADGACVPMVGNMGASRYSCVDGKPRVEVCGTATCGACVNNFINRDPTVCTNMTGGQAQQVLCSSATGRVAGIVLAGIAAAVSVLAL
ncbi:hypothetical protein HK102_002595 [Quaeritorhiza haematococci]|nr:hypothetical protein HK102_002595 [Quaeritorhiza haematococci]